MEKKAKPHQIVSEILSDGRIVELVYDSEKRITLLAIWDGLEVVFAEKMKLASGDVVIPYSAKSDLISKKIVLFPSSADEYGTTEELIERVRSFIHKYLDVSPLFERLASYYVIFTWVFDRFNELAYLRALGDFGSGKSRFLQTIGAVSYKPMFAGGATTVSPIFRIIEKFRGTLVLDEADYRFSDTTAEIVKILNTGYQKGIPILRAEENEKHWIVKAYDVFCPKIIATRERYSDTALESRFLIEEMEKKNLRSDVPINLPMCFWDEARELRNQLLMWRFRNLEKINLRDDAYDSTLEPRLNQIIMPLLSVIDDEELKSELKVFMRTYNDQLKVDRGMGSEVEIFIILLGLYRTNIPEPTVKVITDFYNKSLSENKEKIQYRKAGSILRGKLQLKTKRISSGIVVPKLENKEKIESLRNKYGITDEAIEQLRLSDSTYEDWTDSK